MPNTLIHGIVTNGVIVPDRGASLPEGASVEIGLADTSSYDAEMRAWDTASAHAWAMIGEWEREEASPNSAETTASLA